MSRSMAIVTAVTPDYMEKLKWTLPTWKMKPQFADLPLYIFHSGFKNPAEDFAWIESYFPGARVIEWSMAVVDGQRELMLSAFVLGAARCVAEDWFIKLDADTYFTSPEDAFLEDDFAVDLCAHPWGYTKPGWWVDRLKAWVRGKEFAKPADASKKDFTARIISWCCLHRTEFVRRASKAAGARLPVPSHDTYLWFLAEQFDDCSWKTVNLHKRGVAHCSKVRGIRDGVTANYPTWSSLALNAALLRNVQVEVTTKCNRSCPNCDRNCGLARSSESMSMEQIARFVKETQSLRKKWKRIDVIGGEPLLWNDLEAGLKLLCSLEQRIRLTTNGDFLSAKETRIPERVRVRNSAKDKKDAGGTANFDTVNDAPRDHGVERALACSIPWRCGIALTRYGYFPCGAGASIARVFGLDVGIKTLAEVTPENLREQMKQLCPLCGHSASNKSKASGGKQVTSESWKAAFESYQRQRPELTLY